MGYIYKITNDINNKVYIGLTVNTLEYRFKQHKYDSKKGDKKLYKDMRKYGFEHFHIEELEKCVNNQLGVRERFWISYYDSFYNGYNDSFGGEGHLTYDHDAILNTILEKKYTCQTIANQYGCGINVVYNVARMNGIDLSYCHKLKQYTKKNNSKIVIQYDIKNNYIQEFPSIAEAARWLFNNQKCKTLNKGVISHIREVCNNKRNTAYGYIWKFKK